MFILTTNVNALSSNVLSISLAMWASWPEYTMLLQCIHPNFFVRDKNQIYLMAE